MEMSDNNWMSNLVPQGDKDKRLNDNININASQSVQNNINIICINENKDMQTNMNKCAIYIFKPKDQNNKIIYQNKENDKINERKDKENQININKSINNNFSFFEESKRSNLELYEDLNNYSRLINKENEKIVAQIVVIVIVQKIKMKNLTHIILNLKKLIQIKILEERKSLI